MKVKFTRSIFVKGEPYEAGDVAEIEDKEAFGLLAERDVVRVGSDPEKAEAKHPAKENAAKK